MFRKTSVFVLCAIFVMCVCFSLGQAGTDHEDSDPLKHDNLSASTNFLWHYPLYPNPFVVTWWATARASAPSNADGEYSVYAWVEGGQADSRSGNYLGGITTTIFMPTWGFVDVDYAKAKSSVELPILAPAPAHSKSAWVSGFFLLGSPGNIVQHTDDLIDHFTSDDR